MNPTRYLLFLGLLFGGLLFGQSPYEMLWEVQHPSQERPSYVFGTMHISDQAVYDMPDSVLLAMQKVDRVAFELDLDSFIVKFFETTLGSQELRLSDLDHLETKMRFGYGKRPDIVEWLREPDKLKKALEDRQKERDLAATTKGNPLQFLDAVLCRVARQLGKETVALEDVGQQVELLYELNGDVWKASGISGSDLRRLYLTGNIQEMGRMLDSGEMFGKNEKEALIDKRNVQMVDRSDSLMAISPAFIAVGAAHLPGKNGILELLKTKGYRVRPVLATQNTGMMRAEIAKPYVPELKVWEDPYNGVRMRLPSAPFRLNLSDVDFPLYIGMDFQGGYLYYILPIQYSKKATEEEMIQFARKYYANLGEAAKSAVEPKEVRVNGLYGLADTQLDSVKSVRSQVLVGEELAVVLYAGVDSSALVSPALDEIFSSVEITPIMTMTKGEWVHFRDERLGIAGSLPKGYSFTYDHHVAAPDLKTAGTWGYKFKDRNKDQIFWVSVTSLPPYYSYDNISYSFNDIIANFGSGDFAVESEELVQKGPYEMHKSRIKFNDGGFLHLNLVRRGNRLFVAGVTFLEDQPGTDFLLSKLDSLYLLPQGTSPLSKKLSNPAFEVHFPDTPDPSDYSENDHWYTLVFDSLQSWEARDPLSGNAYFLSRVELGPFFRIESAKALADSFLFREDERLWMLKRQMEWKGFDHAWEAVARTIDPNLFEHFRLGIKGDIVYFLSAQSGDSLKGGSAFFDGFRLIEEPASFDLTAYKLHKILEECQAEDSLLKARAEAGLGFYELGKPELYTALSHLDSIPISDPPSLYLFTLLDLVVFDNDTLPEESLRSLYQSFKKYPDLQVYMLSSMLQAEKEAYRRAAVGLLEHDAPEVLSSDNKEEIVYGISGYLANETDKIAAFDSLAFLAQSPDLEPVFWKTCWELAQWGQLEERHLGLYKDDIQRIAADWVLNRREIDGLPPFLDPKYDYMVWVLAATDPDDRSLEYIRAVMDMGDPTREEYAVLALLDRDYKLSSKTLRKVLDQNNCRFYLTEWLLEHQQTRLVPKKYFKEERIAMVELEGYLEWYGIEAVKMEQHEIRTIYYEGELQRLYIFKLGLKGGKKWVTGFSGPFPQKGQVQGFRLSLTGTDVETFPTSEKELSKQVADRIEKISNQKEE